jgi:hypothetical protein
LLCGSWRRKLSGIIKYHRAREKVDEPCFKVKRPCEQRDQAQSAQIKKTLHFLIFSDKFVMIESWGRSSVWLERLPVTQEVEGSSPFGPAYANNASAGKPASNKKSPTWGFFVVRHRLEILVSPVRQS